jgi:CHAT domain-containing protein
MKLCSCRILKKLLCLVILSRALVFEGFAQCPTSAVVWNQLLAIEKSEAADKEKLRKVLLLQKQMQQCNLPRDSVYARILHRLGVLQYYATGELNASISNTLQSVQINRSGRKDALLSFVANSYTNLGLYYKDLLFYREALTYFDSAAYFAAKFKNQEYFSVQARLQRSNIFFRTGNYEKSIDEASLGIAVAESVADDFSAALLLNERAQASINLSRYKNAEKDLQSAYSILKSMPDVEDVIADNCRLMAIMYESTGNYTNALVFYEKALQNRIIFNDPAELANDLIAAGTFLDLKMKNSDKATAYYQRALKIAEEGNDIVTKTRVLNNIGALYKRKNELAHALQYYQLGLSTYVKGFTGNHIRTNPSEQQLQLIADKQLLFILLGNKAEALFLLYQQNSNKELVQIAKSTFYLTDKVIDEMRYSQNTEPTRLFWRSKTRNFYANAVKTAFELNNAEMAFYFIEKSRAVLLNDKLNELGAFARLPQTEAAEEQKLRLSIIALQQQLGSLQDGSAEYKKLQQQLLGAKESFDKFIRHLETKFPAYYQYKYSGIRASISKLQEYVQQQDASFISFFETADTLYAVSIRKGDVQLHTLAFPAFAASGASFLQLCANKQELNSNYSAYAGFANLLYKKLFQPFAIHSARVIISPDQVFLPFDAFTKDEKGEQHLLFDHHFSYTYSAHYLLQTGKNKGNSNGNFLGVAPEDYSMGLQLASLKGSVISLKKIKTNYTGTSLLEFKTATRKNFLAKAGNYEMLHIYAHAVADSTKAEPQLFMQDSSISLSELQYLQNPAVQLVFLSACETNTGRQYRGEGVYSLARGFAAAGIPSTIATLWKADNEAMYKVSEEFHTLIKKGMDKDEALQQAKIQFIKDGSKENRLPFYWASIVLMGNHEAVQLSSSFHYMYIIPAFIFVALLTLYFYKKRKAA